MTPDALDALDAAIQAAAGVVVPHVVALRVYRDQCQALGDKLGVKVSDMMLAMAADIETTISQLKLPEAP